MTEYYRQHTSYYRAVEEALRVFDRAHAEAERKSLDDLVERALEGNDWILGQLHLRSLSNGAIEDRLKSEPELMRRLTMKRTGMER